MQIVLQVEQALRLGLLTAGDQLPTVKDVVTSLAINPNTVLKAYRELEHKGLVAGRPGQGTFIAGTVAVVPMVARQALQRRLGRWMADAIAAGCDHDDLNALFAMTIHDLDRSSAEGRSSADGVA
jgi:GntR family transcriptional regulator